MKTFSLLIITTLFYTCAYAQDTAKIYRPKPSLHQLLRNILDGPLAVERYRRHQDSLIRPTLPPEYHHPAAYIDGGLGYAFLGVHGFVSNFSLNYQDDAGLFTLKGLNISSFRPTDNPYDRKKIIIFDDVESNSLDQIDLMYGKRLVDRTGQEAVNFSAGLAIESRYFYTYEYPSASVHIRNQTSTTYPGIPVEVNWQVFSRRFGASFNLKLSGDISKYSFASIGVALGLGYHYKN
jgi:hypothetical protein